MALPGRLCCACLSVCDRCLCLAIDCSALLQVLLVSSSRHPDKWIVPGGGMEPEEEPSVAAAREVCEEVCSKGFFSLSRLFVFQLNHHISTQTYPDTLPLETAETK